MKQGFGWLMVILAIASFVLVGYLIFASHKRGAPINTLIKKDIHFEEIFKISADETATPRGFIDTSNTGDRFWVVDGKLAFIVTYFDPDINRKELRYDGKVVPIDSIEPPISSGYSVFDDKLQIGGKSVVVKSDRSEKTEEGSRYTYTLLVGDQKYAEGNGFITEIVEYRGEPAYVVSHGSDAFHPQMVVMHKDRAISKEYQYVGNLKVVEQKLAFIAQTNTVDRQLPETEQRMQLRYALMWDGKQYGTEHSRIGGFVASNGKPVAIVFDYIDGDNNTTGELLGKSSLLNGDQVIWSGQSGEQIWNERALIDVNGALALIVSEPSTKTLYVSYDGKKFLEGYDIFSIRNVNGKLAVLAGKGRTQYVFIEKEGADPFLESSSKQSTPSKDISEVSSTQTLPVISSTELPNWISQVESRFSEYDLINNVLVLNDVTERFWEARSWLPKNSAEFTDFIPSLKPRYKNESERASGIGWIYGVLYRMKAEREYDLCIESGTMPDRLDTLGSWQYVAPYYCLQRKL